MHNTLFPIGNIRWQRRRDRRQRRGAFLDIGILNSNISNKWTLECRKWWRRRAPITAKPCVLHSNRLRKPIQAPFIPSPLSQNQDLCSFLHINKDISARQALLRTAEASTFAWAAIGYTATSILLFFPFAHSTPLRL